LIQRVLNTKREESRRTNNTLRGGEAKLLRKGALFKEKTPISFQSKDD